MAALTDDPDPYTNLTAFLNELPDNPYVGATLHVGALVYDTIRALPPAVTAPYDPSPLLTGLPVINDPRMHPRRWEARRGDTIVKEGWLGQAGDDEWLYYPDPATRWGGDHMRGASNSHGPHRPGQQDTRWTRP